jgi:hypothetical protein
MVKEQNLPISVTIDIQRFKLPTIVLKTVKIIPKESYKTVELIMV